MQSDIFVGARIRLTNIKSVDFDPRVSTTHKPPKGKVFVAIVVGIEDKSPESIQDVINGDDLKFILQKLIEDKLTQDPILDCTITSATGFF